MSASTQKQTYIDQAESEKRAYSVPEIAAILQISRSRAYELCREDHFKTVRIGKAVRVSRRSFDEWLDEINK